MTNKTVRTKYKELLIEEFVDASHLWKKSLKHTNDLILHLNLKLSRDYSTLSYDEYCQKSEKVITDYLECVSFSNLFCICADEIHKENPKLNLLFETKEYQRVYDKTKNTLVQKKTSSLEKDIHKSCTFEVIRNLIPDEFHNLENSLESMYLEL